ncbi:hypothetical protein [Lichenicoccus sp.]|uniref:hypothetical protein n=1 Tax=Lichenicoccus sp. TaxID=2781899 RepID=UPI003D0D1F4A
MSEPLVGIFWGVPMNGDHVLVIDTTALSKGESYGEFLTHPKGHYEVWEAWRRQGAASLAERGLPACIAWQEYEDCPRGRVVYHRPTGLFTIYADPFLQPTKVVARIVAAFALAGMRREVRGDAHYRTATG